MFLQTFSLFYLALCQFILTAFVWVGAGFQFNTNRRALQPEIFAKTINEVAFIVIRQAFGLVTVNHNDRWVAPALVSITEFDAPSLGKRRWMGTNVSSSKRVR